VEDEIAEVARGSVYILAMNIAGILVSVISFKFMTVYLALQEMGVWAVMNMVLGIASLLMLVISTPVKFISQAIGAGEDPAAVASSVVLGRAAIGLVTGLFYAILSAWLSVVLLGTSDYAFVFQLLGIDVVFFALKTTLSVCLMGLNKPREYSISGYINALSRPLCVILFLLLGYGLHGLLLAWIISDVVGCAYPVLVLLSGKYLKRISFKEAHDMLSEMAKFSIPILITSAISFATAWFDKVMILSRRDLEGLGVYNVALTARNVLLSLPTSVAMAISPYYGMKFGGGEHEDVRRTTKAMSKYLGLLFIPASLGLAALSRSVLLVFCGEEYARYHELMALMSVMGVSSMISLLLIRYLVTYEKTLAYMLAGSSSTIMGVVLALALMPDLGLLGVALAKGTSSILLATLCVLATRKELKLAWGPIFKCLLAGAVMASLVYFVQLHYSALVLLPLHILFGMLIYGLIIKLLGVLDEQDIRAIASILPGSLKGPFIKLGMFFSKRNPPSN